MMTKLFFILLIFFSSKSYAEPFDLGDVCQNMWDKAAGNNLDIPSDLNVDTVVKNPLFTLAPTGQTKVNSPVFTTFQALLTVTDRPNMNAFLNEIKKPGGPLEQALNYLNANVFNPNKTMADLKAILEEAWFTPLPNQPFPGKGFKHVFMGEKGVKKKKKTYSGFHNWYRFFLQQGQGNISNVQVDSFTNNTEPSFISMNFQWDQANKKFNSSLFVGTSPAFDFASFSVCFMALNKGPNGTLGNDCNCTINNSTLTIRTIQLSPPKGSSTPTGKICTAFPTEVVAEMDCEIDDCCPTTTTTTAATTTTAKSSSQSGGNDDYYYAKRGCFFICYVFYVFIFY